MIPVQDKNYARKHSNLLAKKVVNGDEKNLVFGFTAKKPEILSSTDFLNFLIQAGHARAYYKKEYIRLEKLVKAKWDERRIICCCRPHYI